MSVLTGFCEQYINSTEFVVTYNITPSYAQSTATLRCIKGYTAIKPGSAVCGSDGEWIIEYPECEGMQTHSLRTINSSFPAKCICII